MLAGLDAKKLEKTHCNLRGIKKVKQLMTFLFFRDIEENTFQTSMKLHDRLNI